MSRRHPCWKALGIEPTDDQRAIRVAYSARLKAIDPEADPQAFVALREAFEAARNEAQWLDQPDDDSWAPPPEIEGAPGSRSEAEWVPQETEADAVDGHANAIVSLLYAPRDTPYLDDGARAELLEHWRAMLADPRMDEVGFFGRIEEWAAQVIAETAPVSSPLVIPATDYFGWRAGDGTLTQSPAVAQIVYRYRQIKFLSAAQRPDHSHYPAWIELTTRAYPGSPRGRVDPHLVFELLQTIRAASPVIETRLDPQRVELWKYNTADPDSPESRRERMETGTKYARWIWLAWLGLLALGALSRMAGGH